MMSEVVVRCQLGAYAEKIAADADRPLFDEACVSAEAGALRMAYIGVWLSCAESLKRRFVELAQRDHVAAKVAGDIAAKEEQEKSIDGFLLGKARDYGFFTAAEHQRLKHVYAMRCVYGHPYEQGPRAEDLASAAAAVVEIVLSRQVKLRHGYLDEQVRLLTTEASFLDDLEAAVQKYAGEVLQRVDEMLHTYFLEKLWGEADALVGDPSMGVFARRAIWFSVGYLSPIAQNVLAAWDVRPALTRQSFLATQILATPDLFACLSEHAQDIVVGNLLQIAGTAPTLLHLLQLLDEADALTKRQAERFRQHAEGLGMNEVQLSQLPLRYWCGRALADMRSYNWYTQNPAVDAVRRVGPQGLLDVSADDQEQLGRNVLQAATGAANSGMSFLENLAETKDVWPEAFVRGVVLECFVNDDGQIRFKGRYAQQALASLATIPKAAAGRVVKALREAMAAGRPKYAWTLESERDQMLAAIDAAAAGRPNLAKLLSRVREEIAGLEAPEDD